MLKRADLFGTPVNLNFNGREKSRSWTGVVFSFFILCFVLWSVYNVGMDIILRSSPKTIMAQAFAENPEKMVISPDTFNFAFGFQDPINFFHYIDEEIYTVEMLFKQLERVNNEDGEVILKWTSLPLEIEICRTDHFGKLAEKFADIELGSLFCLKKEQSALENITIQGVFESPVYQSIEANLRRCVPGPEKVCKNQTVMDQYLRGGYFAVYFNNMAFDPKNYSVPNFEFRDSFYSSTGFPNSKEITMVLNHVEVKSDIGWLIEDIETKDYIKFDKTLEYLHFREDSDLMINFAVKIGKVISQYERSYTKIQAIFAEANGLAAAALIAVAFFLRPYSRIKFFERLINELFDVKELKEDLEPKTPRQVKNKKAKNQNLKQVDAGTPKNAKRMDFVKIDIPQEKEAEKQSPDKLLNLTSLKSSPKNNRKRSEENPAEGKKKSSVANIIEIELPNQKENANNGRKKKHSYSKKVEGDSSLQRVVEDIEHEAEESTFKLKDDTTGEIGRMSPGSPFDSSSGNSPWSTYKSKLLASRPSNAMPQKILGNFEGKSLSEIDVVLESLVLDKEEKTEAKERSPGKSIDESSEQNGEFEKRLAEIENEEQEEKNLELIRKLSLLPDKLNVYSDKIDITFWDYVRSYIPFCRSKQLKEKYALLNEGIRRIKERLDIFNVLKKFREIDKLKLLLLESEQLVLFDTLPKPELALEDMETEADLEASSPRKFRHSKFITEKRRHDLVVKSYELLKRKQKKTMVDEKLLEIYDDLVHDA